MKIFKIMICKLQLRHYKRLWKEALKYEQSYPIGSAEWRTWLNVAADYSCEYYTAKKKLEALEA